MPEHATTTGRPWWVRVMIVSTARRRRSCVIRCWLAVPISMTICAITIGGFWWYYPEARVVNDRKFWVGLSFSLRFLAFWLLIAGTLLVWNLLAIHWVDRNDSWPEQS